MTSIHRFIRFPGFLALFVAVFALSGCYTSDEPLISLKDADFPFQSLTYVQGDNSSEITLVRGDDGYRSEPDDDSGPVLLKEMAENTYLAQAVTGEGALLYAVITVSPDRKSFVASASMAGEADFEAVRKGVPGLSICKDLSDAICIEKAESYLAFAKNSQELDTFRILSVR